MSSFQSFAITSSQSDFSQREELTHPTVSKVNKARAKHFIIGIKRTLKQKYPAIVEAPADADRVNGFATVSFVCGLAGLFVAGFILGGLAIIFSLTAFRRILKGRGGLRGRGFAVAGLLLGIAAIVGAVVLVFE